jgi:hypothetical protein
MLNPRPLHFSHIDQCIRHSGGFVEIVRWYAGPDWGRRSRVYRPTPASQQRLAIIAAGLRRMAH